MLKYPLIKFSVICIYVYLYSDMFHIFSYSILVVPTPLDGTWVTPLYHAIVALGNLETLTTSESGFSIESQPL
jgi:hypothetical protein